MAGTQVFFKVLMGYRPNIPDTMPAAFRPLMVACWDTDPTKRPPFEEVLRQLRVRRGCSFAFAYLLG
jgi:hypothetical protein